MERQLRNVVIPEADAYTYSVMCGNAEQKPDEKVLTKDNIYLEILADNNALDNEEVPETERIIVVTPDVYVLMKQCPDITTEADIRVTIEGSKDSCIKYAPLASNKRIWYFAMIWTQMYKNYKTTPFSHRFTAVYILNYIEKPRKHKVFGVWKILWYSIKLSL